MSPRNWGWAIMLLGVLADSPDSLMVRFLREAGVNSFCIIVWKAGFTFCLIGVYALVKLGGPRKVLAGFRSGWCFILTATIFQAFASVGFTLSLTLTSAANALLFVSLNPLWAALFGRVILKERLPRRTVAALTVAIISALIIFVPSSVQAAQEGRSGGSSFLGDCIAVVSGFMLAGFLTVVRCASKRVPEAQMVIAPSLGAGLAALIAAALAGGSGALPGPGGFDPERPVWHFWCVIVADAVCISACFLAMSIAPVLISGAEAGLIFLLDVALGPLIVWLCYGDIPSWWTLVGGGALLSTLAAHEVAGMFFSSSEANDAAKGGSKGEDVVAADANLGQSNSSPEDLTNIAA